MGGNRHNKPIKTARTAAKKARRKPVKKTTARRTSKQEISASQKRHVDAEKEIHRTKRMAEEYASDPNKTESLLDEALKKAKRHAKNLKDVWDDLMVLIRLIRAWIKGAYSEVPWRTILIALGAIIYFVNRNSFRRIFNKRPEVWVRTPVKR